MQKRVSWKSFSCYVPVLYLCRRDGISQNILQERGLGKGMSLVAFPKIKAPKLHWLPLGYETGSEERKILLGSGRDWWNLKALLSQHHAELFSSSFFQSARKVAKSVFFFFFPPFSSTPFSSRLPIFIGRKGRRAFLFLLSLSALLELCWPFRQDKDSTSFWQQ